jgi:SAM-dependent methyltransferase
MKEEVLSNSHRNCPVCGSDDFSHFADEQIDQVKINNFTYASRKEPEFMCLRLVKCNICDLVYAPEPPSQSFLHKVYGDADYDSGDEAIYAARTYAKELSKYIQLSPNRNVAIDVGAGSGPFLPWLCEQGYSEVIGVEPSKAAIDAAPDEIKPMLVNDIFNSDLVSGKKISLACSFMTLEHIENPKYFVESIKDNIEDNGMIAVVVHNWRSPLNRMLGLRSPIIDIEHLQLFSPKSISKILVDSGFSDIKVQFIWNSYPLKYWLRLLPLPGGIKKMLTKIIFKIKFDKLKISLPVGNMLVVGYMKKRKLS